MCEQYPWCNHTSIVDEPAEVRYHVFEVLMQAEDDGELTRREAINKFRRLVGLTALEAVERDFEAEPPIEPSED